MLNDDREYLERRLREEHQCAENAADPAAYRSHIALAQEYERRLLSSEWKQPGPTQSADRGKLPIV